MNSISRLLVKFTPAVYLYEYSKPQFRLTESDCQSEGAFLYFNKTPRDSTVWTGLGSSEPDDLRVAFTSGIRWFDTSLKVSLFYL